MQRYVRKHLVDSHSTMNDSVSAPPATKLDLKLESVYPADGPTQHHRSISNTASHPVMLNAPRTPTDARHYHPTMMRTTSMENSNNPSKSM